MKIRSPRPLAGFVVVAALAGAAITAAPAGAATVHLRVEGASSTLFDGSVNTNPGTITATNRNNTMPTPVVVGPHPCNYSSNGNPANGGSPKANAATAIIDAGLSYAATWYGSDASFNIQDVFLDTIAGEGDTSNYWALYADNMASQTGACSTVGSDIVWGLNGYSGLLKITGPATAQRGTPTSYTVTDVANGNTPVAGATVAGATTNASGVASVTFPATGTSTIKANDSADGYTRSAGVAVCVHDGYDGNCGFVPAPAGGTTTTTPTTTTPDPGAPTTTAPSVTPPSVVLPDTKPPVASVSGIDQGERFPAGKGPQTLKGTVVDPATRQAASTSSGIASVKIRLTRKAGKKCSQYSKSAKGFKGASCRAGFGTYIQVSTTSAWSYTLARKLGTGSYTLEVKATDKAGNTGPVRKLTFRVG